MIKKKYNFGVILCHLNFWKSIQISKRSLKLQFIYNLSLVVKDFC